MTDHASFLQTILAQPDDDLPRLIYADWLEEQGDAARAEFIRVQCELVNLPRNNPRRRELRAREIDLLAEHGGRWRAELPSLPGILWLDFDRGFPTIQASRMAALEKHVERLFTVTPVQVLRLVESNDHELGQLAQWPQAAALRRVTVYHVSHPRTGLRKLVQSPHLQRLHTLAVEASQIDNRVLADVAPAMQLPALTALYLPWNRIGNKGVELLLNTPLCPQLTELGLDHNQISALGAHALLKAAHLDQLTLLDLRSNDIVEPARSALRERFGERVRL